MAKIVFPDERVSYKDFLDINVDILNKYIDKSYIFTLNNDDNLDVSYIDGKIIIKDRNNDKVVLNDNMDTITSLKIEDFNNTLFEASKQYGGRKAPVKKEVCGRLRCIYKIAGSRKEHLKYKGQLITVADYKKLMKKA